MKQRVYLALGAAAAIALVGTLAGCGRVVPQPAPQVVTSTPAPRPTPAPALPPSRSDNWADAPASPGTWRHRQAGRDSIADFVGQDGRALFQLICTGGRDMALNRIGAGRNRGVMTVRTRTMERTVAASAMENAVSASLTPSDPLIGAMAYSRGRFAVEVEGMETLFLPSWPEVTRVLDDCQ